MKQVVERDPEVSHAGRRLLDLGGDVARLLIEHPDQRDRLPRRFDLVILPVGEPEVAAHSLRLMTSRAPKDRRSPVFAVVDGPTIEFLGGPARASLGVLSLAAAKAPSI